MQVDIMTNEERTGQCFPDDYQAVAILISQNSASQDIVREKLPGVIGFLVSTQQSVPLDPALPEVHHRV